MQRRSLLPSAFGGFTTPSPRHGSDPFLALHREMNRLFDEAFRGFGLPEGGAGSEAIASGVAVPRIDVSETDQDLKVVAELPGVDQNDVEITLSPSNPAPVVTADPSFRKGFGGSSTSTSHSASQRFRIVGNVPRQFRTGAFVSASLVQVRPHPPGSAISGVRQRWPAAPEVCLVATS